MAEYAKELGFFQSPFAARMRVSSRSRRASKFDVRLLGFGALV
jgi:hypothetical protein